MRTEKVSLTLEGELLSEAREVVGAGKLSSYINRALRHQLQHDRLAGLLAELEQEKGAIPQEILEEVRREWPAHIAPEVEANLGARRSLDRRPPAL